MTIGDWILIMQIGFEDGPAIADFVDELNSNPKCVRGIKAIEHAVNRFHARSSTTVRPAVDYAPSAMPSVQDIHNIAKALQNHSAGPSPEGNPDADAPGGSHSVSI